MAASFFTEDYLQGAVSGAAGSCGRETGSIGELSLLRAVLFESEVETIFGMKVHTPENGVRFKLLRGANRDTRKARNLLLALLPPARARSRQPLCSPLPAGSLQYKSSELRAAPLTAPSRSSSVKSSQPRAAPLTAPSR